MANENKELTHKEQTPPEDAPPQEIPPQDIPPTDEDQTIHEGAITPFEGDYMEVTIDVADHLAKYEKAIDTILNFMIRRTYAGDWVSHDKKETPIEDRSANMIGAAAERIARDLGIQESNRTKPKKIMSDKHPGHYTYECEGDFSFRGRTVHAIGRSSTLNPFYSKRGEGVRKPEDIREEYIIRDCWRDCTKQGVKGLFGLRKIPIMKLKDLGYDITKIKYVNFQEGGQGGQSKASSTARPDDISNADVVSIGIAEMSFRKWKDKDIMDLVDVEGVKYSWWGKGRNSDEAKTILGVMDQKKPLTLHYVNKDGKYNNIDSIEVSQ